MNVKFDFSGQKVLVTGSSRGIGRAVALAFAQAGAAVTLHYHKNRQAAHKVLEALPGEGHDIEQCDLSSYREISEMIGRLKEKGTLPQILVSNAGIFEEFDILNAGEEKWLDKWERTLRTNLHGPAFLAWLLGKEMASRKHGRIIQIGSRGAFRGEPDAPAYGASKAGLHSFGQSLAVALAPHGVEVYSIAPGFVNTDMAAYAMKGARADEIRNQSPMKRIAEPEEIAQLACFLASEGHGYMTGAIIDINGASYLRS
ncbi:MAG: SDR family oxidoreductase [Bacteroidales bacterium]